MAKTYVLAAGLFCCGSPFFPLAERITQATFAEKQFSYKSGQNTVAWLLHLGSSGLHCNQTWPRYHLPICANVSTATPPQPGCLEKIVRHAEKVSYPQSQSSNHNYNGSIAQKMRTCIYKDKNLTHGKHKVL